MRTLPIAVLIAAGILWTPNAGADGRSVSALGRIEPKNGVYHIAGPSDASVVSELLVKEGQLVKKGDDLARLDIYGIRSAELQSARVNLDLARKVLKRQSALKQTSATSASRMDAAQRDVLVGEAAVKAAQERLDLARVKAPVAGQILEIHAREGERIGPDGLLDLGRTDKMYAVAEVFETDVALVHVGQHATITSPALDTPLTGVVDRIGKIIGKNDVLNLDPVAKTDSKVVEAFVLLDHPEAVASLTYLQVQVELHD